MKKNVLFLALLAAIVCLSCSKKNEDGPELLKADFTALVGDWKLLNSADVSIFTITGRGTVMAVEDNKVNTGTLNAGKAYFYIRYQTGSATSYDLVPYSDAALGTISQPELSADGFGFLISKNPSADEKTKYACRGIIIPQGKSLPVSVNVKSYTEVAKYLGINN